ncbi:structural protein [Sulfolobales Mexican rudivirus 1]|uniref:Structural protein n=1 Tax=Sulfolobales Mexican rod-shaped virus 1 TaxID=2848122 RepID=K4PAJ6_9VIRU|nr:structural protein [Sulfolobales Mexican rudivirus 1]AFV51247.1 structural protein [Sulfolobales Mexican rod-shaped virus 1]
MTHVKGSRNIVAMKERLYRKVLSRQTFPAFLAMVNAGTSATLPTALSGIVIPPGYNTDYGILYSQLIAMLLQGVNNYLTQILSGVNLAVANTIATALGQFPFNQPVQNAHQIIVNYGTSYDAYVSQCSELIVPAVFDETLFDLSAFQPAYGYQMQSTYCQQYQQQFAQFVSQIQQNSIAFDVTTLGVGKTNEPAIENAMYNAIQGTGVAEALSQANVNFYDLPDLAQFALAFLSVLNQTLSGGVALDASWLDRSALSEPQNDYQELANNFLLQNLAQFFGVVLDFTPLDFAPLMPEFPEQAETLEDLIATLSAEKTIVSIFAMLFANHMYDPSLGGTKLGQSQRVESYAEMYNVFLHINDIVKRRYTNVMYAKMVVDATMEIARYPYRGNLSYDAGARSLPYNEFLTYWKNKWSFYGLKTEDLQYAQQLGEMFQAGASLQSTRKLQQVGQYAKKYKPLFYRKGYAGVGSV